MYMCSWSLHAKEAADNGKPCRLVDSKVHLNADFPIVTCNNQEIFYLQDLLTSPLFHHLDVISCEDQTYFLHILVQWQPKTNDTHTCYIM